MPERVLGLAVPVALEHVRQRLTNRCARRHRLREHRFGIRDVEGQHHRRAARTGTLNGTQFLQGLNPNRSPKGELPNDPEPHQVEAWVELAELVQDADFRASVRRMAEYQAAERHAGDRTGLHHDLSNYVRERVAAALTAGIDPAGSTAAPILDDLAERYAAASHHLWLSDHPRHVHR